MTVRRGPENLTRFPFELGWRPSPDNRTPALTSSSLYRPMAVSSSVVGITPASESLFAFTTIKNRISVLLESWFDRVGHLVPDAG